MTSFKQSNQSALKNPVQASTGVFEKRWHDPLKLIQDDAPSTVRRIVIWVVITLVFVLIIWATVGKLDVIASAEGKLVPQTLLKVVQPAESGVVTELLVSEGSSVEKGQILARLDTTYAKAEQSGLVSDLAIQKIQERRVNAELAGSSFLSEKGEDPALFASVSAQFKARITAQQNAISLEEAHLEKLNHEMKAAQNVLGKMRDTLPAYEKIAHAYMQLEKEGFMGGLIATEKHRDATEKASELEAQKSNVAALAAGIIGQKKRVIQLKAEYRSELQRDLIEIQSRISQLLPNLAKTNYRTGLMVLRAPQQGTIKDLATTTVGAVVQPGAVLMTLVPKDENLYADVSVKNEDVGFTRVGQRAQLKLAAYPFQKYGLLTGTIVRLSLDSTNGSGSSTGQSATINIAGDQVTDVVGAVYRARIRLDQQFLKGQNEETYALSAGMQVSAEIHQGRRTITDYLLSPMKKTVAEAGRER